MLFDKSFIKDCNLTLINNLGIHFELLQSLNQMIILNLLLIKI
jgi:hypothetical protein